MAGLESLLVPRIAMRCPTLSAYCIAGRGQGSAPFLRLRVAGSLWRRAGGLFLQRRLAAHEGLWLRPCRAIHTVGMRSAIDVVFLDRQGNVVNTVHSLPPNRAAWCWRAHSVVELPAHYCRKNKYYAAALKRAVRQEKV